MTDVAPFAIRRIEPRDDATVAAIIRATMTEFGCAGEGFAIHDAEVDAMSAAYASPDSAYWVVEVDGRVLGCGGFARLAGTTRAEATAEVRKMYFRDELRGRGAGKRLLAVILESMRAAGYRTAYLETTTQMSAARALYQRFGFTEVCAPAGATGHHGCDRFLRLALDGAHAEPPSSRRLPARDARFAQELVTVVRRYVARLGELVSWPRLARIPGAQREAGFLRGLTDRAALATHRDSAFLLPSSRQRAGIAALARESPAQAELFRFACLCEPSPAAAVRLALGNRLVDDALACGILGSACDALRPRICIAPFGNRAYVADARGDADCREPMVYLGETTLQEWEYCRTRLPAGKRRRALEIGTGTGLVVLELRDRYDHWDGAEFDPRSVAFSRLNAELQGATNVRFFPSDLFSGAEGRYDLILFNPWQPSEASADLIERFLLEAPAHLEADGRIVLLIESGEIAGRNAVVERIARALAASGMSGVRHIRSTYGRGGDPPGLGVTSVLWIGHGVGTPGIVRTRQDPGAMRAMFRRGILRATGR